MPPMTASVRKIYAAVSRIPRGRVATYGQVAAVAGLPRRARLVGYALRVLPDDTSVPWHRVVNAQGRISPRGDLLGHEELQAHLLAREGVRFTAGGAISFDRYGWQSGDHGRTNAASSGTVRRPAGSSFAGRTGQGAQSGEASRGRETSKGRAAAKISKKTMKKPAKSSRR